MRSISWRSSPRYRGWIHRLWIAYVSAWTWCQLHKLMLIRRHAYYGCLMSRAKEKSNCFLHYLQNWLLICPIPVIHEPTNAIELLVSQSCLTWAQLKNQNAKYVLPADCRALWARNGDAQPRQLLSSQPFATHRSMPLWCDLPRLRTHERQTGSNHHWTDGYLRGKEVWGKV